jgi:hypothetical protein
MNKKLFALLTSAAIVAACAPAAFAEAADSTADSATESQAPVAAATATLSLKAPETAEAGKDVAIDVYVDSDVHLEGIQFNFTIEGGEIVDFVFDDGVANLGFTDKNWTKEQTAEAKEAGLNDYAIMLGDYNMEVTTATKGKLGTLTVKGANAGDTIKVNTNNAAGLYDYGAAEAEWTEGAVNVTVAEASSEAESSEATSESTSEVSSNVSSDASSTSSTADSSSSSKATTTSSKAGTNGTTSNTNTGAASTAAVALAASAAALVVISKKRK